MLAYFYIHEVVHYYSGFLICELFCIVQVLGKLGAVLWCLCNAESIISVYILHEVTDYALPCFVSDFYDWRKVTLLAFLYFLMVTLPFKMSLSGVLKCGLLFLSTRRPWHVREDIYHIYIYILANLYSTMNYSTVGCELDVSKLKQMLWDRSKHKTKLLDNYLMNHYN